MSSVFSYPARIRHESSEPYPAFFLGAVGVLKMPINWPDVKFEPAGLDDVGAIAAMADEISRQHYLPDVLTESQLASFGPLAYAPEVLSAQMQSDVRFEWILHSGRRVGFLAYAARDGGERLNLGKLYLEPACHGLGIGQVALWRVQDIAEQQGAREIYLYVFRKNGKAIRAYQRAGFIIDRAESTPCSNGFCYDDYVMVYHLKPYERQNLAGKSGRRPEPP